MREPEFSIRFEQRAENCEQRAIKSTDPLVAEILIELAKDFRSRAKAQIRSGIAGPAGMIPNGRKEAGGQLSR